MKINELITNAYSILNKIKSNLAILHKFLLFITPFLTIAYYFIFISSILPAEASAKYSALVIAYFFPPAGKESIIPLMLSNQLGPPISPWIAGSTIVILDIISSAIIAYNWWFAELIINHIGIIKRGYVWLHKRAEKFKKMKWINVGLLLFMIIPFQGTGGISTTIISRLLGLSAKRTVAIVFAGSIITTGIWILWWMGFLNFLKGIFFIWV